MAETDSDTHAHDARVPTLADKLTALLRRLDDGNRADVLADTMSTLADDNPSRLLPYTRHAPAAQPNCATCAHLGQTAGECTHGRKYSDWRREELAYGRLDAWLKFVPEAPDGGIRQHGRTWNWTSYLNGGRVQYRASSVVALPGELPGKSPDEPGRPVLGTASPRVMLRDPGAYAPQATPRDPIVDRGVKITFPDWAMVTPCE